MSLRLSFAKSSSPQSVSPRPAPIISPPIAAPARPRNRRKSKEGGQLRRPRNFLAIIDAISCKISPACLLPSGVGLGHQSALLGIQSIAAFCDSSFPTLFNEGAFELTLLLLGQCGRRKCQKCYCDDPEHRHLPICIYTRNTANGCSCCVSIGYF